MGNNNTNVLIFRFRPKSNKLYADDTLRVLFVNMFCIIFIRLYYKKRKTNTVVVDGHLTFRVINKTGTKFMRELIYSMRKSVYNFIYTLYFFQNQ